MDNMSDNNISENVMENEVNPNDSEDFDYNDISEGGWIQWFCQLEGNDYFVEIEEEFIRKSIKLYKLDKAYPDYKNFMKTLLSPEYPGEDQLTEE